jgi:hypothetical protein
MVLVWILKTIFEPFFDSGPGRFIGFIFVMRSDMPDSKLSVSAVKMCPAMN